MASTKEAKQLVAVDQGEGDFGREDPEIEGAFKRMIKHLEMEETSIKQTDFQKPLDMKNDQISELQKCRRSRTRRCQGITWL